MTLKPTSRVPLLVLIVAVQEAPSFKLLAIVTLQERLCPG